MPETSLLSTLFKNLPLSPVDRLEGGVLTRKPYRQVAAMTPSVARTLKSKHLPELRTLILGGEALSREHLEGWPQTLHIINAYGPAEGSGSCSQLLLLQARLTFIRFVLLVTPADSPLQILEKPLEV